MKILGTVLLVIGLVWMAFAFNMETTVTKDEQDFGSGVRIPRITVLNLALVEARRTQLTMSAVCVLVGTLLLGFGTVARPKPKATGYVACSKCAGMNETSRSQCRYCYSALQLAAMPSDASTKDENIAEQIERLIALKQQGALSEAEFQSAKDKVLAA